MIFNIVIVSPLDHWDQCKLLLDSIDRHLVAHRVYLIDNTPELGLPQYKLKNNHLYQIPWSDLIISRTRKNHTVENGWITQQLLKLSAYKLFPPNEQYVCIDSKTLILSRFIDWPTEEFPMRPQRYEHDFYKFYDSVCQLFELEHVTVKPPQVPYILNSTVIKELIDFWGSWDIFQEWFTSFTYPSEFWLYDLWCQRNGKVNLHPPYDYTTNILHLYNIEGWKDFIKSDKTKKYEVAILWRALWNHPEFQQYRQDLNFLKLLDDASK
jgi:hypothetical protein